MIDFKIIEHTSRLKQQEEDVNTLLKQGYKIINSFAILEQQRMITIYQTHLIKDSNNEQDNKEYAVRLCRNLMLKHYPEVSLWRPMDDLMGVLTQIDNICSKWNEDLDKINLMRSVLKYIQSMADYMQLNTDKQDVAEGCRLIIKKAQEALDGKASTL
jgi:hypothetical protein